MSNYCITNRIFVYIRANRNFSFRYCPIFVIDKIEGVVDYLSKNKNCYRDVEK